MMFHAFQDANLAAQRCETILLDTVGIFFGVTESASKVMVLISGNAGQVTVTASTYFAHACLKMIVSFE